MTAVLRIARPGVVAYEAALAAQERLLESVQGGAADALLLLEHPAVYTLGRGADATHLRHAAAGGIPIVRVGRGGQVTYHGPGQLIGYPILDLRRHRQDVRWYVRALEQVLIDALAQTGITAGRREGYPGVWVDGCRKIASIGVGIRRWVTWHGFALNVGPDLSGFQSITPCGIDGVTMTSLACEGGAVDVAAMRDVVQTAFLRVFAHTVVEPLALPSRASGDAGTAVSE